MVIINAASQSAKYTTPVNTKHCYSICAMLDQRRRRWADVVQMLYNWFVFDPFERVTGNI